jgi:hypothetical protein
MGDLNYDYYYSFPLLHLSCVIETSKGNCWEIASVAVFEFSALIA